MEAVGRSVLTLKVADQDSARLDPKLVSPGEGRCEYDVYGASAAGAVSLNLDLDATRTSDLLAGRATQAQVLSPSQIRYLREVVGIWPLPHGLRKLRPMNVRTYRTNAYRYKKDILPDGEQYAEISRKAPRENAMRTMEVMHAKQRLRALVPQPVFPSRRVASRRVSGRTRTLR